jgi:hypothetical protein
MESFGQAAAAVNYGLFKKKKASQNGVFPLREAFICFSQDPESNRRPTLYESVALPTEPSWHSPTPIGAMTQAIILT